MKKTTHKKLNSLIDKTTESLRLITDLIKKVPSNRKLRIAKIDLSNALCSLQVASLDLSRLEIL